MFVGWEIRKGREGQDSKRREYITEETEGEGRGLREGEGRKGNLYRGEETEEEGRRLY